MVAHEQGYDNILQLHIDQLSILSSVNQSRFLAAESCRVSYCILRLLNCVSCPHLLFPLHLGFVRDAVPTAMERGSSVDV